MHFIEITFFTVDEKTELPAGKNAGVILPAFHRDPTYFSNPDTFDPDRFD